MGVPYREDIEFFSNLFDRLFPILRSITGPGLRQSYQMLGEYIPFECMSVASGTKVFDWSVPLEWSCEEAYIVGPQGNRVVDMANSNLHVLNYSQAVDQVLSLEELQPHLYSLENIPEAVPYVSSYYKDRWGFCLSHKQRATLTQGSYRAVIKSQHKQGKLDLVQTVLSGKSEKEILISSYMCHPSLANNELSGPLVLLGLYHRLKQWSDRYYTYRFVLHPETIGSLCLLHLKKDEILKNTIGGMVLNMLGGEREAVTFKHSIFEDGPIDKIVKYLQSVDCKVDTWPFDPNSGADERQYAMPGFRIPVCNVSRDFYHNGYKGYHNSLDTKEYMQISQLLDSIEVIERVLRLCDKNRSYNNMEPYGEPQLGPRGLYPTLNFVNKARCDAEEKVHRELCIIKWILALSDGQHDLLDIADRSKSSVYDVVEVVDKLAGKGLLKPASC